MPVNVGETELSHLMFDILVLDKIMMRLPSKLVSTLLVPICAMAPIAPVLLALIFPVLST